MSDDARRDADEAFSVGACRGQGLQVGDHNDQVNHFGGRHEHHHYPSAAGGPSWPVVVGRAPLLADAFQFRPGLRMQVDVAPAGSGPAAIAQVMTGDGGTGKTQLAASVFRQLLPALEVAVWVVAATREAVVAAYAQAQALLHPILGGGVKGAGDGERAAARFLTWLETTGRAWMVVLDDVADPADLRGLWPTGPSGRVVVTTRRRDAALVGHGRTVVDVGVYTPDEAVDFFTRKLATSTVAGVLEEAGGLAADLGFLPLALGQASAVILDEAITCRAYRARYADATRPLAEAFDAATGEDYGRTVATTWTLAIDRADNLPPFGLAGRVLRLAAVLDPNGAPDVLYTSPVVLDYLAADPAHGSGRTGPKDRGVSALDARRGLRNLHRLSLISHDPGAGARAVRMHALAQRATLEGLARDGLIASVRAAADALARIWSQVESDAGSGQALRANVAVLADRDQNSLWAPAAHDVLFRAGRSLGETGQVAAAAQYHHALHDEAEHRLGGDHPDTLNTRHHLAYWQGQTGDPLGALQATQKLLSDRLRVQGCDHPDTLNTRANLAYWRGQAGNPAGAMTALAEVLTDRLRVLGPDHPDTLSTRHNLARWQGQAGDATGAMDAFAELLTDRLRVLGPDHPHTLVARHSIAYWRGMTGDPAAAAAGLERLLTDRLRVLGADHPDTLTTRYEIARTTGNGGNPAAAADALALLLADRLRVLGPDHPDTLATGTEIVYWRARTGVDDAAGRAGKNDPGTPPSCSVC